MKSFVLDLDSQIGYSVTAFLALQVIFLLVFGAMD